MFFFTLSPISAKEGLQVGFTPAFDNGAGVVISVKNLGDETVNNLSISLDIPEELRSPATNQIYYFRTLESGKEMIFKIYLRRGNIERDLLIRTILDYDEGVMIINFIVPKMLFESVPLEGIALTFGGFLLGLAMFVVYKNRIKK